MTHGPIVLLSVAVEFDADAEDLAIASGAPTTPVLLYGPDGEAMSDIGRAASSPTGSAVSAAVLAAVSTALTTDPTLAGANARLSVHSSRVIPSTKPGDPR